MKIRGVFSPVLTVVTMRMVLCSPLSEYVGLVLFDSS